MKQSWTANGLEKDRIDARKFFSRAHPDNVLVVVIGNLWEEGCEEAINEMVKHTRQEIECWMDSIRPYGFPAIDHCSMRDLAVKMAKTQGFEWVFPVDTDIKVQPDTLLKLIKNQVSIVAPHYLDPKTKKVIGDTNFKRNSGLQKTRWITSSVTLFRTAVFNCPETKMQGCWLEHDFWLKLWDYGHFPYIDTNTHVELLRSPSRSGELTYRDRQHIIETNYDKSRQGKQLERVSND